MVVVEDCVQAAGVGWKSCTGKMEDETEGASRVDEAGNFHIGNKG